MLLAVAVHIPGANAQDSSHRLRKLFEEVDELARCTYASVTLETLAGNYRSTAPIPQ